MMGGAHGSTTLDLPEALLAEAQATLGFMVSRLEALPVTYPSDDTWRSLVDWTERASVAGVSVGVGDLLIAAIATENAAPLCSLDSAFGRLERLRLISPFEPARRD